MDLKNKITEIFTKANGRKTKFLYTNMMEDDNIFLTSLLDNIVVSTDINFYFTYLEIKENKEEIFDFLNTFYINKKEDFVFNMHTLLALLNKIKWDLSKIKTNIINNGNHIEVSNKIGKVIIGSSRIDSTHYNNFKYKLMKENMKNSDYKVEYYPINKNEIKDIIYKYKINNKNSILDGINITILKNQVPTLTKKIFLKIRIFDGCYDYGICSYQEDYISDTFRLNFKIPFAKGVQRAHEEKSRRLY